GWLGEDHAGIAGVRAALSAVIPAQAGIQTRLSPLRGSFISRLMQVPAYLDSRLRGNDAAGNVYTNKPFSPSDRATSVAQQASEYTFTAVRNMSSTRSV